MKLAIVGGNGFIGKSIIKEALINNIKVCYLSRNKGEDPVFKNDSITWLQSDIFNIDINTVKIIENYDILIHLVGIINNKNLYRKINTNSVEQSVELCKKANIKNIVFLSANGGGKEYLDSKLKAENIIKNSNLNYLIVKPGLIYGKDRISSYLPVIPIKILAFFKIKFFEKVYPVSVKKVSKKIISVIINKPLLKDILTLDELKNK